MDVQTRSTNSKFPILFSYSNLEFSKWLYENKIGNDEHYHARLLGACVENRFEEVKWLLDVEADVNMENGKPLATACGKNNLEIAKYLHGRGVVAMSRIMILFARGAK